jgi:hypothetical protein
MNKKIIRPSVEIVQSYISKFNNDQELTVVEDVLAELFGKYPDNQIFRDILIKATTLNSLYNTNIYAIVKMAKHILNKNIDAKLQDGSPELVGEIAHIEIDGKIRNNYSFASKYCHWQQPEKYPIYDSYVDNLLWRYRKQDKFIAFTQAELRQYPRYKQIIEDFKNHYGISQFKFRDLDKFLWGYGKEIIENKQ